MRGGSFTRCLSGLVLFCLFAFAHPVSGVADRAPQINTEQQPNGTVQSNQPNNQKAGATRGPTPLSRPLLAKSGEGERQTLKENGTEQGTEFWPPFSGYRLKVTDTLIAIFTACLFLATLALWLATRNLAKGADKQLTHLKESSEKELRAYVYIENGHIIFVNDQRGPGFIVNIVLRNFGKTPGREFSTWLGGDIYEFDAMPFPEPKPLSERVNRSIIGPTATAPIVAESAAIDDLQALIEKRKAIFVWGGADYIDAFGQPRFFIFRMRMCGPPRPIGDGKGLMWPLTPHPTGYIDG